MKKKLAQTLICLTAFILCGCAAEPVTTESATAQAVSSASDTTIISTTLETTVTETATDTQAASNTTTATTEAAASATTTASMTTEITVTETATDTQAASDTTTVTTEAAASATTTASMTTEITAAETSEIEEVNPGTYAGAKPRYVVINGRKISPFISAYYLFTEIDGKYKCYRGYDYNTVTNLLPSSLVTRDFVNEILSTYEPAGTAVYTENARNEFETTMEAFDGAKIYITDDAFEPYTRDNAEDVCILMVTSEPYRSIEGMDFYFCTYITPSEIELSVKVNNT